MQRLIILLSFLFNFIFISHIQGAVWFTVSYGYWNDPGIWNGGVAPPLTFSDTIMIKHPLVAIDDIVLNPGGLMVIDSSGGLCGHEKLVVKTNSTVIKYGICEMDSLLIPGGHVYFYGPGIFHFTYNGLISNGGIFNIQGAGGAFGPWFNCQMPEYSYLLSGTNELSGNELLKVYPNPAMHEVVFETHSQKTIEEIIITGIKGEVIIFQKHPWSDKFNISEFDPGLYFYSVKLSGGNNTVRGKFVISR